LVRKTYSDNVDPGVGSRFGKQGQQIVNDLHGRFYEQASRGNLFTAHAIVTAPVIYTTAAGTGGPLLWNGSSTTMLASILAVGWGISVVTTVAAILGLTGNTGQTAAPGSTTAIDSVKNCYLGGGGPACTAYRVGTPTSAGNFFHPLGDLNTGALTTTPGGMHWVDIGGMFVIPQYGWISFAASATASTTVGNFGSCGRKSPFVARLAVRCCGRRI
jgi:hypothetical protein